MTDIDTLATIFGQLPETGAPVAGDGVLSRPLAPRDLDETGLSPVLLQELILKIIHYADRPTVTHISQVSGLPSSLVTRIMDGLKQERLCEVNSSTDYTMAPDYKFSLTKAGDSRAEDALNRCRYAGVAPVPITQYENVISSQSGEVWRPSQLAVRETLDSLVLDDQVKDRLARALLSGHPAMIFGPSGNGKTHLLSEFMKHLDGEVLIPYSIYAHGQIIRVFDQNTHERVAEDGEMRKGDYTPPTLVQNSVHRAAVDHRWVRIRRPGIMVGGELGPEALELAYDPITRFYQAPAHLKAQGGILIIDDFGRQKLSPVELLNRLILPLERRRDHLLLRTGEGIEIPFQVTLLFSTNLNPKDLADAAYLRRIPYKVHMPSCGHEQFYEILRRACVTFDVACEATTIADVTSFLETIQGELSGALARDLASIIADNGRQDGLPAELSLPAIEFAYEQFSGISPAESD